MNTHKHSCVAAHSLCMYLLFFSLVSSPPASVSLWFTKISDAKWKVKKAIMSFRVHLWASLNCLCVRVRCLFSVYSWQLIGLLNHRRPASNRHLSVVVSVATVAQKWCYDKSEKRNRYRKKSLKVWASQEIRMYSMCPCHSSTRKACSQCQREEVGPFFTRGSSSPNAHADFLRVREREREREREKGGSEWGEAEIVEWCLISSQSR